MVKREAYGTTQKTLANAISETSSFLSYISNNENVPVKHAVRTVHVQYTVQY
jgi:hypothetical protein